MENEPIWNPEEDDRYQRMESMNELLASLDGPFGSCDDLAELMCQSSSMQVLSNMLSVRSHSMLTFLVAAIQEVVPPAYHDRIIKRYRALLAETNRQQEQIRAENLERQREAFRREIESFRREITKEGEEWREGNAPEWNPEDEEEN